ncbi:amino acid permease, partial [Streptomyces sp. NPDC058655]
LAILGVLPGGGSGAAAGSGGLLPHGWNGVVAGFVAAIPAFGGLEVVTIAAAESANPARAAAQAVRSAVWRISVFYIGSMIVVVSLLPWSDSRLGASPFVAVLDEIGVPAAGQIMNVIVVIALLSALNANTYAAARMVFSLAQRGQAPPSLSRLSRTGVPYPAVLASTSFGFVGVVLNLLWPRTIFLHLLNAVGAVLLLVWVLVACSQLRLRRDLPADTGVRMWGHPHLSRITLGVIGLLLVSMFVDPDTRVQMISSAVLASLVLSVALVRSRRAPA